MSHHTMFLLTAKAVIVFCGQPPCSCLVGLHIGFGSTWLGGMVRWDGPVSLFEGEMTIPSIDWSTKDGMTLFSVWLYNIKSGMNHCI